MKCIVAILGLPLVLGAVLAQNQTPASPSQTDASSDTSTKTAAEPVFRVGGSVKPPRVIYSPDPEYPKNARGDHQQKIVVIWMVVGSDGLPRDVRVHSSPSPEFSQAALDVVTKWKFDPATKDGKPVAVQINVEIAFKR